MDERKANRFKAINVHSGESGEDTYVKRVAQDRRRGNKHITS